jgi:aspartate aminotransferase
LAGFKRGRAVSIDLSQRVGRVRPSATVALTGRIADLRAAGRRILSLAAGEPDFATPEHIVEAAIAAMRAGHTRYTAVEGITELRDAIVAKFARDNGLDYRREQVLVSTGGKQTLFNLALALLDSGDEVVIPAPYWVSYPEMARLAGAVPVIVSAPAEQGYRITAEQLEGALTSRTRLVIINSPSNPTGAAYSRAEFEAFGAVLEQFPRALICTDDMYEHIYWGAEPFVSFAAACPQHYERTVTVNGVSKAYAMTGWRIGYCGGPAEVSRAMGTIQSQSTSNPCSVSQYAALAALTGDQSCVTAMNDAYRSRHDWLLAALNRLPGTACRPNAGTFYALADVSDAIDQLGLRDDIAFAEHLVETAGVAVVPGSAFGAPGHVRLSYACSLDTLEEAVAGIAAAVTQ